MCANAAVCTNSSTVDLSLSALLVLKKMEHLLTMRLSTVEYKYMKTQPKQYRTTAAVKIGVSRQVVIPKRIHDQLGLEPGDYLEVELDGDRVVLTPKALIEKRLAEGLDDIRKGRIRGPFQSVPALVRSLRKSGKARTS
jgi:AbrB family looped-hinge helix DNA binding protein